MVWCYKKYLYCVLLFDFFDLFAIIQIMTLTYILSQVFVLIAVLFFCSTYFTKNRTVILICRIFCAMSYVVVYILLGAYTGVAINVISVMQIIVFYFFNKKDKHVPLYLFIIFEAMYFAASVITWSGWVSVLMMVGSMVDFYTIWQTDIKVYRLVGVLPSVLFIGYDIAYRSYVSVGFDAVVLIIKIISVINIFKRPKPQANQDEIKQTPLQ